MNKVLIGCEESQVMTEAFRNIGIEAYSNDILPCSGGHPEWHLQMDVFEAFERLSPTLCIFFPPCTDLSAAGAPSWKIKQADGRQQAAIDFVLRLYNLPCDRIAIENPTGILNTKWKKPDQIINPFQFGDPFKKRTCLWLKGLPLLEPTDVVEPLYHYTSNSTRGGASEGWDKKEIEFTH